MIKIIKNPIARQELIEMIKGQPTDLLKAVVDVKKEIMAIGGDFHSEEEELLIEQEFSEREHTWGINFYPDKVEKERVEFDSLINLKPFFNNRSREVENPKIREKIKEIIRKLILD